MRQRLLLPWGTQAFWKRNKQKPSSGHLQSLEYFILMLTAISANHSYNNCQGIPIKDKLVALLCRLLLQNVLGLELMEQPHIGTVSLPWIKTSENCFLPINAYLTRERDQKSAYIPMHTSIHPSRNPLQLGSLLCHHWGHVFSPLQRQLCNYEMC